jgi:hypothetical protein
MSKNFKFISVKELSKILKIHFTTLNSWLCHFSLSKYVFENLSSKGKLEQSYKLTKSSVLALRKYLKNKRKVNLEVFDKIYMNND